MNTIETISALAADLSDADRAALAALILQPVKDPAAQLGKCEPDNTNYAFFELIKKGHQAISRANHLSLQIRTKVLTHRYHIY